MSDTPSVLDKAGKPSLYPFPHVVVPDALPQDFYDELAETRPPDNVVAQGETGSNVRKDIPTRKLKIARSSAWGRFIERHTGRQFWGDVLRVLGAEIRLQHPTLLWRHGDLSAVSVGVRGTGEYDINTECQIGVNTPTLKTPSSVRGPHIDNPVELYAGLLYMPDEDDHAGGDLQLCELMKRPQFYGKAEIAAECTRVFDTVPYEANMFVMFINSPIAVHSVTERQTTPHYRRLVNIIGETKARLF